MKPPLRPLAADPTSWASISIDVARRIALLGDDRGPQPGVAAADDAQVAADGADQGRVRVRLVDVLVPVRVGVGVGDRVEVSSRRSHRRVRSWFTVFSVASGLHPTVATATVSGMDLGIDGRRAAVAGASGGLGLSSAKALAASGRPRRDLRPRRRAHPQRGRGGRARLRAARVRRVVGCRRRAVRRRWPPRRSAASTSSCRTPAARRPARSRRPTSSSTRPASTSTC